MALLTYEKPVSKGYGHIIAFAYPTGLLAVEARMFLARSRAVGELPPPSAFVARSD